MVAVDAEDGHPDVEVGIGVIHVFAASAVAEIDLRVAHQTERYGSVTIHMVSQDLKITSTLHKSVTSNIAIQALFCALVAALGRPCRPDAPIS